MNSKIQSIKQNSRKTVKVKFGEIEIEWELRPIPPYDLMKNFDLFQNMPKELKMDTEHMTEKDVEFVQHKLLPIMEVILPACSVDPVVTAQDDDPRLKNDEAIHIRDIGFGAIAELFAKITEMSGMSKPAEEARKNLPSPDSQKP